MERKPRLGTALINAGLITQAQLDEALALQASKGERIGKALITLGYLSDADLLKTLCKEANVPYLTINELQPDAESAALLDEQFARSNVVLPLRQDGRTLVVAMANPFDIAVVRSMERLSGRPIRVLGAATDDIKARLDRLYRRGPHLVDPAVAIQPGAPAHRPTGAAAAAWPTTPQPELRVVSTETRGPLFPSNTDEPGTAAELADTIIQRGVALGATDIHIEPLEDMTQVRYRIDGILQNGPTVPRAMHMALMGRIKILASLDIAESRLPQDGRVRLKTDGRSIDLRISTFPTVYGEDVVLRVLDRARVTLRLESLGIDPSDLQLLREVLQRPHGLIPVTGPTGSGKTTTLYSAMLELNTVDRCIITLEDPVEYEVANIRQSQINVRAGLTFASGLRSILRHDPDTILVGEMRDHETVQIALSAALTGHLVLTTLHTTTAAGTIPRLLDMGAEPFVLASAISLLASQRLVRTLCANCKAAMEVPSAVRSRFHLEDVTLYGPVGCSSCRNTGYRGRLGIFEFLPITPEVVSSIYERRSAEDIHRQSGRPTLLDDGVRKVRAGLTTLDELMRVTT
jgi:type IV pilus assembly protein PilB